MFVKLICNFKLLCRQKSILNGIVEFCIVNVRVHHFTVLGKIFCSRSFFARFADPIER
jgi:hypothetical protein